MSNLPDDQTILQAVRDSKGGPVRPKTLARIMDIPNADYRPFRERLRELERQGKLYRVKGGRYAPPDRISLFTGSLSVTGRGDGFVRGRGGEEVFVRERDLDTAMDGDRVVVRVERHPRGRKPEGRVIKVLERAHTSVVGVFHEGRKMGFVVPRDPRLGPDIAIPWGDQAEAADGDVVLARITAYGSRRHAPTGEVEKVLGPLGEPGVDVLAILYGHGVSPDFPADVEAEAAAWAGRDPVPGESREDLRDRLIFTIDPVDAKDHDDALSIRELDGGGVEVGIHIADVSAFVGRGSALDQEALSRGTSVYLVDRVIPMLPHALSSNLCSLRPDEDRAAVSLLIDLDGQGRVQRHRFTRSVIRSRHKLSYEQAQGILDGRVRIEPETDAAVRLLHETAVGLRARKDGRGALDIDLPEARVILDEVGVPVDIQRVERLDSHRLVEDFMLLANEVVARECEARELPALYRVHEPPTQEKLEGLREFLGTLGLVVPRGKVRPRDLSSILDQVRGRPEEKLVSTVVLRSLQKARYAPDNLGHFGLALDHYSHFTSPIRRYPDLVTHRAVVRALVEGRSVPEEWWDELEDVAETASLREQAATQAERDSIELKKVEYMEQHLGDEFTGTISGVQAFGAFVLLDEVFVDGLMHVNSLKDDYYEFREEEYALVGSRRGRRFRLGDRVRVQVARVDREERHVDFLLLEHGPKVV